ncbi:MAG: flagellar hook-associated protein FlgK [Myxococcota bacterium]
MSSLLYLGASGFQASQQSVRTASDNIANVDTPAFRRRESIQSARATASAGRGQTAGGGVQVDGTKRVVDRAIERQLRSAKSSTGRAEARFDALSRAEVTFNELDGGRVTARFEALIGSFEQLAAQPQDIGARQRVLSAASEFASNINALVGELRAQQRELGLQATDQIGQVNELSDRIAELNQQIGGSQNPSPAMLDRRDEALHSLSELVEVEVIETNGQISVSLRGSGYGLVTDGVSRHLSSSTLRGTILVQGERASAGLDLTVSLTSGALAGTLDAANRDLSSLIDGIEQFAADFANTVNRVHGAGFGIDGQNGRSLFSVQVSEGVVLQVDSALVGRPDRVAAGQDARLLPGDNRNAVELSQLRQANLPQGLTAEASLRAVVVDFAVSVQSSSVHSQATTAVRDQLEQMQAGLSGVSLDEEMTRLLQFRQSYAAAAQVIRTADELMREVVSLKR